MESAEPGVVVPIPRKPAEVKVEVPVAPKLACDDARYCVKRFVPVAFVKVSPPLKAMRVVVALPANG
jgi:hypothetical protein